MGLTIAILIHEHAAEFPSSPAGYLIELLANEWRSMGFTVEVVRGTKRVISADVVIPHIDLTVLPGKYRKLLNNYPVVVNRNILDISKSKISTNIVTKSMNYCGPVIVKTNYNHGGLAEADILSRTLRLRLSPVALGRRLAMKLLRKMPQFNAWRHISYLEAGAYPIFPSLSHMPNAIFENRSLVVEKYIPETNGDEYLLRYYYFFGDMDFGLLLRGKERIVKMSNSVAIEEIPVPGELRALRARMQFDYGRFDCVVRDGQVVVLDANRTPACSALVRRASGMIVRRLISRLAEGIWSQVGRVRDCPRG